jgi:hypothetical protein
MIHNKQCHCGATAKYYKHAGQFVYVCAKCTLEVYNVHLTVKEKIFTTDITEGHRMPVNGKNR